MAINSKMLSDKEKKKRQDTLGVITGHKAVETDVTEQVEEIPTEGEKEPKNDSEEVETPTTATAPPKEDKQEPIVADQKEKFEISYKRVPDEKKTKRKNIILYPSLTTEIERIVSEEGTTFNDLVNQLLLDYAIKYNKKQK